jgi:hypothetical protein
MKTEVYSWRLSGELKSDLEREARTRKVPVSSILDMAVRDWLNRSGGDATDDELQRRLHFSAANFLGAFAGQDSRRSETVRENVRKRLKRRNAR